MRSLLLPNLGRSLAAAGKAAAVALAALVFAFAARDHPTLAFAVPAVFVTALFCARWPAAAVTSLILLSGGYGSLQAFAGISAGPLVDLLLAALWASLLVSFMLGTRERPWWIWPGVAILLLYAGITFLEIATAATISIGLKSFSYSASYMLLVPLLGLAGWRLATYLRISRALIAIALAVASYAALRQVIGPAASESQLAAQSAGVYNEIGGQLSLLGSFPNRHELAFWAACAAPFLLAATLVDRGRGWRLAAAAAIPLCLIAVYATDVRAAIPALVAGSAVVILLNQLSAGARATGQTVTALAGAAAAGAILFVIVVGPESSRYSAILSPSGDPSYEAHIKKWDAAIDQLNGHPFGLGLGTAGRLAEQGATPFVTAGSYSIDSSYLKIALEQGFPILALFILAMIAILVELMRRAIRARSPGVRSLAIGAAGTLTAAISMFVAGKYIESLDTLFVWIAVGAAIGAISEERAVEEDARKGETPLTPSPAAAGSATDG